MTQSVRQSIIFAKRPAGAITDDTFIVRSSTIPDPGPGEVLTRTLWLSIDPYMRGRLNEGATYATGTPLGSVMTGETIGEVVASAHPGFAPGDIVAGAFGWETHILSGGDSLTRVPRDGAPLSTYLGVLGMPGTTAYSGMEDIGQPKPGETVVVSAACGPVGATAGQIARRAGARVIGIAGGPEKCRWVTETARFDACLDHRGDLVWSRSMTTPIPGRSSTSTCCSTSGPGSRASSSVTSQAGLPNGGRWPHRSSRPENCVTARKSSTVSTTRPQPCEDS